MVDNLNKILICGFSGSGKTALAQALGSFYPGYLVCDTDALLEERWGQCLAEWVEQNGWEQFRLQEGQLICSLIAKKRSMIISLGGGGLNQEVLSAIHAQKKTTLIWLKASFELCWGRIINDPHRPLVQLGREQMYKLFEKRAQVYQKADLVLPVDGGLDLQALATNLYQMLSKKK